MRKINIITLLSLNLLWGGEKIEIMAEDLSATDTQVIAKGNVVVHYDDSVLQSSEAIYDRQNHLLTLSGKNVELFGYKGSKIESDKLRINTQSKVVTFQNAFMSQSNDVWIYSNHATKKDNNMTFGPSILSSCDVKEKDWSFYSDRSHYDGKEHYMKMHDVQVKFWDVPVFYTPYLAFSTHKERSSGFLFPSIGYSQIDGVVFEQPIYWAPSKSWDFEFRPQYRSQRGYGAYGTFRFADSPYSIGAVRAGYFTDKEDYVIENDVRNDTHYGFEMLYDSSTFLSRFADLEDDIVDGLYINAILLNDIDYVYLQKSQMRHFGSQNYQESRFNYFIHNDDYSLGTYAKYFIDTRKNDNSETMQTLPTIQLHKYLNSLFLDSLTYSADLTVNNYTRDDGITLKVAEFYMPVEYTHSFIDDYLSVRLKEDIHFNKAYFGNGDFVYNDYQYANSITRVGLFSDLTKRYSRYIHVIQPSVTYSIPGNTNESPTVFQDYSDEQRELYSPSIEEENLALKFSQYLYDEDGDLIFYERITQLYHPDNEVQKLDDFNHEMEYMFDNWDLYNSFVYSFEFNKLKEISTYIEWKKDEYSLMVSHYYKKLYSYDENNEIEERNKYNNIEMLVKYKLTDRVGIVGGFIYDLDESYQTQWRAGMSYNKNCWNISFDLRRDIRPISTNNGVDSVQDNSFGIQLNFVPFGGVGISSDAMSGNGTQF